MLSYMRKNAGSWIIKVMLVGIALTFVIGFGILPTLKNREDRKGAIAKIGNRIITRTELEQSYQRLLQAYQQIYKDKVSEELLKQLHLKETALNGLINNALQVEEARKLHIEVTDEELQRSVESLPYFQRDGRFSKDQYLRVLRLNNVEPAFFESEQRDELLIGRVGELIRDSVKLSDQELWDSYRLDKEKMKLVYLIFDPKEYEGRIKQADQQLREYFKKHEDAYKTPEKRKVVCAVFRPEDYQNEVQVLTGDIEEYYDAHTDQYSHPEEVSLRQILIKVDPRGEKGGLERKRKRLEDILERIHKGEDFAKLAREYSEDPAAKGGGSLGFVKKSDLVPEIATVAFSLKPGEVSGIISSPHGLHILKVEDYRSPKVDPLEAVKASIQEALRKDKARVLARRKAEEYLWSLKDKGSAAMVPGTGNGAPRVLETEYFARGQSVPGIGMEEAFTRAAFSMEPDKLSEVIKGTNAFYVLKVTGKKDPAVPPYEEVSGKVTKDFIEGEGKVLARKRAEEVLSQLRKGEDLAKVAKEDGIQPTETEWFNRLANYIPRLGSSQELKEAAFSLSQSDPLPKSPIEIGGRFCVIKFKEHTLPSKEEFESQKDALRKELETKKQEETYRAWLGQLRAGVEIQTSNAGL